MKSESNRVEYKQQVPDDLEKEAVAFLNYRKGGVMYIGIDKNGNPVGVPDIDGDMLKIKDRLKNNILPSCMGLFDVCMEKIDNKDIIKIIFASGMEKPYYIKKNGMSEKGCYIRVGTAAESMPVKMIESLFAKRVGNSTGVIRSPKQQLTFEQLKLYYDNVNNTLTSQFAVNLELLTEGDYYNYVAYLLADINVVSIKVAKYSGLDRYYLTENNEYGNCSLIKATKMVLDKFELENKTYAKITHRERLERPLWNPVALREALLNAILHNDYTYEAFPKFEIFDDRIEITSYGGLPDNLTEEEFFEGVSRPRNKELMRIFRDIELVEYLGSGMPRIMKAYGRDCFIISENYIRMVFQKNKSFLEDVNAKVTDKVTAPITAPDANITAPATAPDANVTAPATAPDANVTAPATAPDANITAPATAPDANITAPATAPDDNVTAPATAPDAKITAPATAPDANVTAPATAPDANITAPATAPVKKLILVLDVSAITRDEAMNKLKLKHKQWFISNYLSPALELNLVEMTVSDKATSPLQKYRLTPSGIALKEQLTVPVKKLISVLDINAITRDEAMNKLKLKHKQWFISNYLRPALELNLIEMTISDKATSPLQKYRLTPSGIALKKQL
jgi:predicted HTH transcriptional regulator